MTPHCFCDLFFYQNYFKNRKLLAPCAVMLSKRFLNIDKTEQRHCGTCSDSCHVPHNKPELPGTLEGGELGMLSHSHMNLPRSSLMWTFD